MKQKNTIISIFLILGVILLLMFPYHVSAKTTNTKIVYSNAHLGARKSGRAVFAVEFGYPKGNAKTKYTVLAPMQDTAYTLAQGYTNPNRIVTFAETAKVCKGKLPVSVTFRVMEDGKSINSLYKNFVAHISYRDVNGTIQKKTIKLNKSVSINLQQTKKKGKTIFKVWYSYTRIKDGKTVKTKSVSYAPWQDVTRDNAWFML